MSNTQDTLTGLGDEALDSPALEAFTGACGGPLPCTTPPCYVSDEPLDLAGDQQAYTCVFCIAPCAGSISDEALDAPVQQAIACTCSWPACVVSDEKVDAR